MYAIYCPFVASKKIILKFQDFDKVVTLQKRMFNMKRPEEIKRLAYFTVKRYNEIFEENM